MGKESDLYDPWNTKTLGGDLRLDVDTYENVQDNIHLERVNRQLLELTDLIGRVTNNRSSSGPIPGTGAVKTMTITHSEVGAATGYKTIFIPNKGEVWQLIAASSQMSGGSSGQGIFLASEEPSNITTPPSDYVLVNQESSSGNPIWSPLLYGADLFFTDTLFPILQGYSLASGESSEISLAVIRVR